MLITINIPPLKILSCRELVNYPGILALEMLAGSWNFEENCSQFQKDRLVEMSWIFRTNNKARDLFETVYAIICPTGMDLFNTAQYILYET
jgi:hypothetical protein